MKNRTRNRVSERNSVSRLALILALAAGLRFCHLGAQSLWNDEGTSVALALRSLATITRDAAHDIHPPLYYYLLHVWVRLFGTSESAVRALSALAGVGLVAATYLYARRLGSATAALLAALLAALAPFQVYYSQEARMYIWVALWGLLSMLAHTHLLAALRAGRRRLLWAALYALPTLAALYSHYFAVTLVLAQNLAFLLWLLERRSPDRPAGRGEEAGSSILVPDVARPRSLRPYTTWWSPLWRWAAVQALVLLAYVPWLLYAQGALRSWPAVSQPLSAGQLLDLARTFALGLTVPARLRTLAAALALWVVALLGLARRPETGRPETEFLEETRFLDALYLLAPIATMLLLSLRRPMLNPKFLLLATPAFYVLQGRGIVQLGAWAARLFRRAGGSPGKWARILALALVTLLLALPMLGSLRALYTDPRTYRDDYRGIVAYIRATAGPRDALLVNAPGQMDTVSYYYQGPLAVYPLPLQRPLDHVATEVALQGMLAQHTRLYGIFWGTDESDPERFIETWLDLRCFKTLDSWFGNVRLVVYAVPQHAADAIAAPRDELFGEHIRLLGYTLLTPAPTSGDILQLTLFWQTDAPVERRYKIFVHLVDARGNIVAQRDSEPAGGSRPTDGWKAGERVADSYGLLIQPGTPPGEHTLRIGLYDPDSGQRLVVMRGDVSLGDALGLATVPVQRAPAPPPLAALDRQQADDLCWPGVCLVGHSLHRLGFEHEAELVLHPGDPARLVLYWQAQGDGAPPAFVVALEDRRGRPDWEQPLSVLDGTMPAPWVAGDIWRDIHVLPLPAELAPGEYRLTLRVAGEEARVLQRVRLQ